MRKNTFVHNHHLLLLRHQTITHTIFYNHQNRKPTVALCLLFLCHFEITFSYFVVCYSSIFLFLFLFLFSFFFLMPDVMCTRVIFVLQKYFRFRLLKISCEKYAMYVWIANKYFSQLFFHFLLIIVAVCFSFSFFCINHQMVVLMYFSLSLYAMPVHFNGIMPN